jgi:hypothetical protein
MAWPWEIVDREGFADEARARIATAGLESLIEVETADAANVELEPSAWDVAHTSLDAAR